MNTLTIEFLKKHGACKSGIDFCINNKLIGFPFNKIKKIQGDYNKYISWLKSKISIIQEYDQNNNLIHYKDSTGNEEHYVVEYYEDGQLKRYEDLKIPWYKKD